MIGRLLSIPTALVAFCAMAATPQTSEACWRSTSHHYCYYTPVYTHWCHHHCWWPHCHVTASQATIVLTHKAGATVATPAGTHLAASGDLYKIFVTDTIIPYAGPAVNVVIPGVTPNPLVMHAGETKYVTLP